MIDKQKRHIQDPRRNICSKSGRLSIFPWYRKHREIRYIHHRGSCTERFDKVELRIPLIDKYG